MVDAAISESVFNMLEACVAEAAMAGHDRPPSGSTISGERRQGGGGHHAAAARRLAAGRSRGPPACASTASRTPAHAGVVPSGTFRTSEGRYIVIGGNGDSVYTCAHGAGGGGRHAACACVRCARPPPAGCVAQREPRCPPSCPAPPRPRRLMAAIGRPDMGADNPRYAGNPQRVEAEGEIMDAIEAWCARAGRGCEGVCRVCAALAPRRGPRSVLAALASRVRARACLPAAASLRMRA